jgi:predicted transcriptional regulator
MTSPPQADVYVDEPWLHIHWDSVHSCVHSVWKGFANSAEFRAGLLKGLQAVREKRASGYVSDTRMIKVIVRDDQKWAQETVIPLMVAAGLERMALVTAASGLGKLTVEEIVDMVDNKGLLMRTFDSMPAALRWVGEG